MTVWLELVKKHTKMHKGKPNAFKLALKSAKGEYDQMKKKGMVHLKGESASAHKKHRRSQRGGNDEGDYAADEDLMGGDDIAGGGDDIANGGGGKSRRKSRKSKRSKRSKSRKARKTRRSRK